MMEERSCENGGTEKMEEIMLPGFRFHPTDEELVGFYLKRKIQQRSLSIELIRQLDIYKYDPWDLSKLATTGEKEWYFYCPRDRKYRNSDRPNRVTGAGFWKATGTDRPIYSSEGSKCIGLKKSLVFYKGRAAKGIKTDWMMHEFRLPSLSDLTVPSKRFIDKNIPANDSWAICRIFKKANSTAHRALSQSWVSPILPETPSNSSDLFTPLVLKCQSTSHNFCSASIQYGITTTSSSPLDHNIPCYNKAFQPAASSYNTPSQVSISSNEDLPNICRTFLPHGKTDHHDDQPSTNSSVDASSLLLNMSSSIFGDFGKSSETLDYGNGGMQDDQYSGFSAISLPLEIQEKEEVGHGDQAAAAAATICLTKDPNAQVQYFDDQWGGSSVRSSINGWPFMSLPLNMPDSWKSNFLCDSNSSEISTGFSTNKCYT